MINLIYTPQRSDINAIYEVADDALIVNSGDLSEIFSFEGLEDGVAEEIIAEVLPFNPIVSAEKIGNTVNLTVIRFYGADEKELFEVTI